jgi:hypothetical protein
VITDVIMLRDRLMTGQSLVTEINIVQGNIPVLCKVFTGDRINPILKFTIKMVTKSKCPGEKRVKDVVTYISTSS